jgi:glycosyltransferase involved in cell wall biosynthesis
MRILVAHNVPRARTGGMSRIMGFIHDRVARVGDHQVSEFCADDAPPYARGRWGRFGFPWAVYRHARAAFLAGQGYDLINVHEPSAAVLLGSRGPVGRPVVVVTSHGVEQRGWEFALEELRLGRGGPSWKTRLVFPATSLWQSRLALRWADHVFCLNQEDRDYIAHRFRRDPADITRICPGADRVFAEAAAGRDYARTNTLLFAATWRKNKGIEDLVPAFATIASRYPGVELTVLGAGVPDEAIRGAFPTSVRERVRPVRTVSEAETAAAFARADVLLLPSLFEGTPLVLMEALSSGLPVVTTATCGMKDIIRDGENGLLIPIRSPGAIVTAVDRLFADPQLRERLGRAGQLSGEEFTWDQVAAPVAEVYRRLIEGRPARTRPPSREAS